MRKYYDMSFQIKELPNCTFQTGNLAPKLSFVESFDAGLFLISTKIDNLRMDIASHILNAGSVPQHAKKIDYLEPFTQPSIKDYIGKTLVLDVSFLFSAIKQFFNKDGVLNIDISDKDACSQYIQALDKIVLTKQLLLDTLQSNKLSLDDLHGLCLYTGLSQFWHYQKYEPWEHIFFLGLDLSRDFVELIVSHKISFLGIDSLRFGHPFFNFCLLEKIFIRTEEGKNFFMQRLKELKEASTIYSLLNNNVKLYQSLNIDGNLINKTGEFIGLPLPISIESFDNMSLTYPIFSIEERDQK